MCNGRITKVFHSNEPITAWKVQKGHPWSMPLDIGEARDWLLAVPAIIMVGGGPGFSYLQKDLGYDHQHIKSSKSVSAYQLEPLHAISSAAHLAFWHAFETEGEARRHIHETMWGDSHLFEVKLRGLIQVTDLGEITGSEMRVVGEPTIVEEASVTEDPE